MAGCGLDELLQSLRREATSEAEGVAVESKGPAFTLDVSAVPYAHSTHTAHTHISHAPAPIAYYAHSKVCINFDGGTTEQTH